MAKDKFKDNTRMDFPSKAQDKIVFVVISPFE